MHAVSPEDVNQLNRSLTDEQIEKQHLTEMSEPLPLIAYEIERELIDLDKIICETSSCEQQ